MKVSGSSEIYKTIRHNGGHSLLFRKKKWYNSDISSEWFILHWTKFLHFLTAALQ